MKHGTATRHILTVLLIALGLAGATRPATAQDYDLVIRNGRVMDPETMLDAVRNVGVKDGRIAIITKDAITGSETIDATGLVVAPGFIDTHFHALDGLSIRLSALDGHTTGMDLEAGGLNIDEWYASKKDAWPLNYGTTVSHEGARMTVHDPELDYSGPFDVNQLLPRRGETGKDGVFGWSQTRSTLEQINQITALLDEGLRQGALGVGSTVAYMRNGTTAYEMFEVQKAAARYGRLTAAHTRFHGNNATPTEAQMGGDEFILNGMLLGAPVLYCHDNDYGWWEIEEKLQMARAQGYNMWGEYYPYDAASTSIGSEFLTPEGMKSIGLKYEDAMYDPEQDKMLDQAGYEAELAKDPSKLVVIFNAPRKEWLPYWLRMPHMVVAADAMPSGLTGDAAWSAPYTAYKGHPRTTGGAGKALRLGREQDVPLMFTLAQLSYWSAKHLGDMGLEAMQVRGRMQIGMVADITIFDPETVEDKATYKAGEQGLPTAGIPYVIVNGEMVVKDSEFQKVWAGQPIRFPVEEKGRFAAASVEEWIGEFSITVPVDDGGVKPSGANKP